MISIDTSTIPYNGRMDVPRADFDLLVSGKICDDITNLYLQNADVEGNVFDNRNYRLEIVMQEKTLINHLTLYQEKLTLRSEVNDWTQSFYYQKALGPQIELDGFLYLVEPFDTGLETKKELPRYTETLWWRDGSESKLDVQYARFYRLVSGVKERLLVTFEHEDISDSYILQFWIGYDLPLNAYTQGLT